MTSLALESLLAQATILLGAAVVVLLASHRLRLPPIVGLLATGALIGPSGALLEGETAGAAAAAGTSPPAPGGTAASG